MLPKNRGKHPIIWSLALGLNETGSTIFLMDKKIDNGRVISQEKIKIRQSDTATSLYLKLANCAKKQIVNFVKHINKKINLLLLSLKIIKLITGDQETSKMVKLTGHQLQLLLII